MEKLLFLVPDFFLFSFLLLINIFPEYYYNVYSDFFRKKEKRLLNRLILKNQVFENKDKSHLKAKSESDQTT